MVIIVNEDLLNDERRRRKRVAYKGSIMSMKTISAGHIYETPMHIDIKDISYGGIGGVCRHRCHIGDVMYVNLSYGMYRMEFVLQVRWVRTYLGETNLHHVFEVGFMFVDLTREHIYFLDNFIKNEVLKKR